MITIETMLGVILAYLLGSIPTAVWLGKWFYNTDIRDHGSGNAGATNTFRVLGKKAGSFVMVLDILKGFLATYIAFFLGHYEPGTDSFINYRLVLGVVAVTGHIFPVFAAFRGGKGIATLMGMILAVHPQAAGLCALIFIITLIITHYVSLGSLMASVAFPLIIIFLYSGSEPSLKIFAVAIAFLVITTHQKNINRLIQGKENKTHLFKKKS